MQRAAEAVAQAGGAAQDLRHGARRIGAAAEHMAVVAMGGRQLVARPQGLHDGHAGRFLADIEMIVRHEGVLLEQVNQALLEPADHQHALEHGELAGLGPLLHEGVSHRVLSSGACAPASYYPAFTPSAS